MIIGIDLGTTNSLVAVWQDGTSRIIPNALGETLTPSCVGLSDNGEILVGKAARERLHTHPRLTTAHVKRYMGTAHAIHLGNQKFRPEEISAFILRSLKADAEAFLGHPVSEAIISVPAYFNDTQRKATQAAGQLAGLVVDRLINEPTAAGLAYGVRQHGSENQFLIFDLGGGTFDVSILELFEGVMEVRASAGDNFLGGEDFLGLITQDFFATVGNPAGVTSDTLSPEEMQGVRRSLEKLIHQLSTQERATCKLRLRGKDLSYSLDDSQFSTLAYPLLERIRQPIERALRDARIRASSLSQILLAGGASRMPIVRKLVARMFGRFPAYQINPDEVVALGTAVLAGLKMGDQTLEEMVMTDVCPYTMGIEVSQHPTPNTSIPGFFQPILERNTIVPVSRSQDIVTVADKQAKLAIRIFQGEARRVKDNIFLGEFEVAMPPRPAGQAGANVRFTYDVNGVLEVEATVMETEQKCRIVIEKNPGALSPEEIEQCLTKLSKLKLHPRDDLRNTAVLARSERLYQEMLGPLRDRLSLAATQFQAVLDIQDPHRIAAARSEFETFLDACEHNEDPFI